MAVKITDNTLSTQSSWDVNIVRTARSGNLVSIRIDASAKVADSTWITVATGLPNAADNYYFQGYAESSGAYKIRISNTGELSLSNRSGKIGTYIDTLITYTAQY